MVHIWLQRKNWRWRWRGGMSDYERRLLELEQQLKDQQAAAPTTTTKSFCI